MTRIYNPDDTTINLQPEEVAAILASHDESCPDTLGYYPSVDELAKAVRGSTMWAMGSTFIYAESKQRFLILKQIAPSSCEMFVMSQTGAHDVLTAYRFSQEELVIVLQAILNQVPVAPHQPCLV